MNPPGMHTKISTCTLSASSPPLRRGEGDMAPALEEEIPARLFASTAPGNPPPHKATAGQVGAAQIHRSSSVAEGNIFNSN